ncbi:Nucleic acid-binding, OB-fold containing protein [Trema orientale]|uniref:Nucleic acid-binding, OB-fold containing protein n=1 Tax=Trema orientale TaxID=63057 RepID=A0A2P5ES71_TREOI|nr:Nucleic acid-binding, OB-fold containing protein [Trema orientale]
MDWDLWNWSHDQVTLDHSACEQSGWLGDFYVGCGRDVIEENALNERSCIQVLRVLIGKADTEIDELEKDLVSLETELAFTEHEGWPEIWCSVLSDKMDCLDISIKSLKSKSKNDIGVQLSTHREPAEKIHDLLRKYLQEKEKQKQPLQVNVLDLKSDASDITVKEEFGETGTPTERCTSSNSSSNRQEKKTNIPKKLKLANSNTADPGPECLRLAAGSSDEEKKLVMSDSDGTTRQSEGVEQELNCEDKRIIQNAPLKHEEKRSCNVEVAKVNEFVEARNQHSTAKNLQPEGNQGHQKINEHSNAIVKYISPDALIRSAAVSMRNKPSEFKASNSRTLKSDNCDKEQKPAELFTKPAQKEGIKSVQLNKDVSSNLQSKMVVNRRDHLQLVTYTQQLAMTSEIHLGKNSIKTKLEEVGESEVEKSQKVVACDKFRLDLGQKQQSRQAKRKIQSNSQSINGPTLPLAGRKLNASSISASKRQKSDIDDDNVVLKQLIGGKHLKKTIPRDICAKGHNNPLAMILPFSQPQESKETSKLPLSSQMKDLTVNFADSNGHATDSDSFPSDHNAMASVPLSSPSHKLDDMKVQELKILAKQYNISKVSKLKKKELVEQIAKRQGCQ